MTLFVEDPVVVVEVVDVISIVAEVVVEDVISIDEGGLLAVVVPETDQLQEIVEAATNTR